MTVELIQGLLLAFALIVILMPPYIRLLQALGFGKRIREEGPETHYVKEGTPTMGGLLIVLVVLGIFLFLREPGPDTFAPLAAFCPRIFGGPEFCLYCPRSLCLFDCLVAGDLVAFLLIRLGECIVKARLEIPVCRNAGTLLSVDILERLLMLPDQIDQFGDGIVGPLLGDIRLRPPELKTVYIPFYK